uniref:Protein kinase domain-containing protein n=1 Tax=Arcella intermedia TaxID=1963864 RepID=A0A6B2KZ59_9EUKA
MKAIEQQMIQILNHNSTEELTKKRLERRERWNQIQVKTSLSQSESVPPTPIRTEPQTPSDMQMEFSENDKSMPTSPRLGESLLSPTQGESVPTSPGGKSPRTGESCVMSPGIGGSIPTSPGGKSFTDDTTDMFMVCKENEKERIIDIFDVNNEEIENEKADKAKEIANNHSLIVHTHPHQDQKEQKEDLDGNNGKSDDNLTNNNKDSSELDMFNERDAGHEDIFSGGELKIKKLVREAEPSDDSDGYYCFRIGEVLKTNYQIIGYHGKGMFSNVLKANDLSSTQENTEVAIKLIRNNDHMKRTGKKEVKILQRLSENDPEHRCNIIRLITHFEDRDHLCLVFEPMDLNLRQLLKKTGGSGFSIGAIRLYAFKLLKSLVHLKRNGIIHCDIKPDNILISQNRKIIKLADLGSAIDTTEEEIEPTPILVSRFYRSPEIILGYHYGFALDVFSFGCCLYEWATGKVMLRSAENNEHLRLILEIKGPLPKKILQHGVFRPMHYDDQGRFLERVEDPANNSNKEIVRINHIKKPNRSLLKELLAAYPSCSSSEKTQVSQLADLIDKCLELDPSKRIDPTQALNHPLFKT